MKINPIKRIRFKQICKRCGKTLEADFTDWHDKIKVCKCGAWVRIKSPIAEPEAHKKRMKHFIKCMKKGICKNCGLGKAPKEGYFWKCKVCGDFNPPYYSPKTLKLVKNLIRSGVIGR